MTARPGINEKRAVIEGVNELKLFRSGDSPPWSRPVKAGWTRHQEKCREASFDGADGVVGGTTD
jgi:hypothetical protein